MTKRKSTPKKTRQEIAEAKVDNFARILQLVAIVAVVAVILIDTLSDTANVPIYVPAGLMGVAIGLSPDEFVRIIKAFWGRGK